MIMIRGCLLLLAIGSVGLVQAQNTPVRPPILGHALITHQSGKLTIQLNNSRPVEQALAGLRREYGLTLDYEEGESNDPARINSTGNRRRWVGGSYTIKVNEPASSGFADCKKFIAGLLSQFASIGSQHFTEIIGENDRITVSPSNASERILDMPITLQSTDRTIDQTIEAILAAVSQKIGRPFFRGGIIDNGTASGHVTVGSTTPIAARILLAQALDSLPYRRFWIQTWEPSDGNYYIGIQGVVKTEITMSGAVREIDIHK
jgi:hypothetical protein